MKAESSRKNRGNEFIMSGPSQQANTNRVRLHVPPHLRGLCKEEENEREACLSEQSDDLLRLG